MGKIILCCPFYNENLVANIQVCEASKWVDEIHVTECNKSFKYGPLDYCCNLEKENPKVRYHQLDGDKYYFRPKKKSIFTPPSDN